MRIRCAICDKPVDRCEQWYSDQHGRTTIKVFCHGDTDQMTVSAHDLYQHGPDAIRQMQNQEGIVFAGKQLCAPSPAPFEQRAE